MACELAQPAPLAISVPQVVDALVAAVADANTRALFSSFARIQRQTMR
jgi:hypothetical protein